MGVSKNSGFSPQIIHFDGVFYYKPSILGIPLFLETPILLMGSWKDVSSGEMSGRHLAD